MKNILVLILVITITFSCKNESSQDTEQQPEIEEVVEAPKKVVFEIDFTSSEPDKFSLFSRDVFMNNNQLMDISVNQKLNSNQSEGTINMEFPEGVTPDYNLGFSLGPEKVKEITINRVSVKFGDNTLDVTSDQISKYFAFNKFVEFDAATASLKTKKVEGKHNPAMTLKKKFLAELTK